MTVAQAIEAVRGVMWVESEDNSVTATLSPNAEPKKTIDEIYDRLPVNCKMDHFATTETDKVQVVCELDEDK